MIRRKIASWTRTVTGIALTLSLFACSTLYSATHPFPLSLDPDVDGHMQIRFLGSLGMKSFRLEGLPVVELSGIGWDRDEELLYAVSDEGLLYHIRLTIRKGLLEGMEVIRAFRLKAGSGRPLKGSFKDAEGLSLINAANGKQGDSQLLVSFENSARISLYTPDGDYLKEVKLPHKLKVRKNYRHKNRALESVTLHNTLGVITAAEFPLREHAIKYQSVYSDSGKSWHFPAAAYAKSAVTGLETLPNGDLLILERAWSHPLTPIVINLRQLHLNECNAKNECRITDLATLSGADNWILDNFEGLAHFEDNKYLMVSDNNQNPFQTTVLVLFEINEPQTPTRLAKKDSSAPAAE